MSTCLPTAFWTIVSHGNSKENKPFFPTWKSTISQIKGDSAAKGPKAVIEGLSEEVGEMLGAVASGQLPNKLQIILSKDPIDMRWH